MPRSTSSGRRSAVTLPIAALTGGALLFLAGCGERAPATDAGQETATPVPAPAAEVAATVEAPVVAPPPKPAAGASAADTAPLTEAAAAENLIETGTAVTRVRHGDGWAWMRDGQVLRTASADGRRVSYYRQGSDNPYLVQDGERTFTYAGDKVRREYDRQGHGQAPSPAAERQAHEAEQAAQRDRQKAEAAAHAPSATSDHRQTQEGRTSGSTSDRDRTRTGTTSRDGDHAASRPAQTSSDRDRRDDDRDPPAR